MQTRIARIDLPPEGFRLSSGAFLPELQVAYETYGALSENRDNVIYICHALTGDAHAAGTHGPGETTGWWDDMIGPGKGIDTRYYHVVCGNILGGCKGTTGPSSTDPRTGRPYGSTFPAITLADIVEVHARLLQHLGIERLAAVIGGSLGGMQALEWTVRYPERIDRCICIASATHLSTQALAFDIVGRKAITSDPDWQGGDYYDTGRAPNRGLAQARRIGHITYLSPEMMELKFGRERRPREGVADRPDFTSDFEVESYLDHQGEKFLKRFDANSYLCITRAMDEYDLAAGRGGLEAALRGVRSKVLVVALSSDWLFPPEQSLELATALLRTGRPVSYCMLHAPHGHDAFLVDIEYLSEVLRAFLPWVTPTAHIRQRAAGAPPRPQPSWKQREDDPGENPAERRLRQEESKRLLDMIAPGSRVLDLGCGDGRLLSLLVEQRAATGLGADIDIHHVIDALDRGLDVFQMDIDELLAELPDNAYDYAILSETLQVVLRPREVLRAMLRVAREGIVTFPNFGKWSLRLQLAFRGRMPKDPTLPYEWHDTPNIHLFTLTDFAHLCRDEGVAMTGLSCIGRGRLGALLVRMKWCNLGADRVLAKVSRTGSLSDDVKCPACRSILES